MSLAFLQLSTAAVWLAVAAVCVSGTVRLFFGSARRGDQSKSAFFFAAMIFVGGNVRWLLAPDNVMAWEFVYGLTILLALYVLVCTWNMRRDG